MTPAQRRLIVPVFALGLALLLLLATVWVTLMNPARNTQGGAGAVGGPFALINHDGATISDRDLRGRPFIVFFGFTHCPDVCPAALMDVSKVLEALGPESKISVLFISIDPERDTPAVMKDYVSNFDKRIIGVTGPRPSIDALAKTYRVYQRKVPGENGEYTMDHSTVVYLMDKRGQFATSLNLQRPANDVAAELRPYL